jgi:putative membrane protein
MATPMSASTSLLTSFRPRRKHLRKYSWLPDVLRLKGSVVGRIIGPVLTVTLFASLITYAWSQGKSVKLTNSVVPLLSVVVGLILVFRNGTSYDRYWEGRKAFSTLTSNIRSFSRAVWINVGVPPSEDDIPAHAKGKTPVSSITPAQLRRRKVEALRLALSFAFAAKHYLRGEDGTDYDDYIGVLPSTFPRHDDQPGFMNGRTYASSPTSYSATGNTSRAASVHDGRSDSESKPDATKRVRPKRSKRDLASSQKTSTVGTAVAHRAVEFLSQAEDMTLPLPLQIAHYLSMKTFQFRRDGLLETIGPAGLNSMSQLIQSMVDQLTSMERIANTPIPRSYGIHLKQCVTLYLFALPFTLVDDLGWGTIPVVTVVAFTFMGIEGIAEEIEMPFGTDASDLPLDRYCEDLKEEINYVIHKLPEGGEGKHGYDDGEGDD